MNESIFLSKISDNEKDAFTNDLIEMNHKVVDFNSKAKSFLEGIDKIDINKGLSYLDAKNIFLSVYMQDILHFTKDKANGEFSEERQKSLINLKVLQEKLKPIDNKIKSQLDRYQRIAEGEINTKELPKSRLIDEVGESEDEGEIQEEHEKETKKKNKDKEKEDKYIVNKTFFDFNETDKDKKKRQSQIEKKKKKLIDLHSDLLNEISDRPEEITDDYSRSKLGKFMKEVDDYERDNYTNVIVGKKKIKAEAKKDRKDDDLGNFASEMRLVGDILEYEGIEKKEKHKKEEAAFKIKNKLKSEKRQFLNKKAQEKSFNTDKSDKKMLNRKRQN